MSRRELASTGPAPSRSATTPTPSSPATLLFVSGIVPGRRDGRLVGGDDVVAQARQVFAIMARVLAAAGATPADVVKVTVYLLDIDDRPQINPVRQEFFGATRPASTLVEVSRLAVAGARSRSRPWRTGPVNAPRSRAVARRVSAERRRRALRASTRPTHAVSRLDEALARARAGVSGRWPACRCWSRT